MPAKAGIQENPAKWWIPAFQREWQHRFAPRLCGRATYFGDASSGGAGFVSGWNFQGTSAGGGAG
jgi:hypothetical protein